MERLAHLFVLIKSLLLGTPVRGCRRCAEFAYCGAYCGGCKGLRLVPRSDLRAEREEADAPDHRE